MAHARYTVLSISRGPSEPAWRDEGERSTWTLTLSDSAGKRHVLHLAHIGSRLELRLPSTASLTGSDPDFTGSLSTDDYLRGIRGA